MAHGAPDWNVTQGQQTQYQVQDLGELAARLGSPDVLERRGNVVLAAGFEDYDNRVDFAATGGAGVQFRTAAFAHHGSWSLLLQTPTGGGNTNEATWSEPALGLSNAGLEVAFMIAQGTPLRSVELLIDAYNGSDNIHAALVYRHDLFSLRYVGSAPGEQVIANNVQAAVNVPTWNMMKFVTDAFAGDLLRAIFNGTTYVLPLPSALFQGDARSPRVDFTVKVSTLGPGAATVYLDDLIITQNEP